jgi:hypothetical protein
MLCVARYENTGAVSYRELLSAAARANLDVDPQVLGASPQTLGHAISLALAAWRSTAKAEYLERARALGERGLRALEEKGPSVPAEGADTLVLALVELHLSILHITAVDCPPNTIDR